MEATLKSKYEAQLRAALEKAEAILASRRQLRCSEHDILLARVAVDKCRRSLADHLAETGGTP